MTDFIVTGLYHDLVKNCSSVTLQWKDDPERRLVLLVPFGCALAELDAEAAKAIAALANEIQSSRTVSA
jgi:hypothetical protein